MSRKPLKCPECGRDTKFIRAIAELIPMPATMPNDDLRRKPPFEEMARNFLVECPQHGEKVVQEIGHHVSSIPKRSNKKKH